MQKVYFNTTDGPVVIDEEGHTIAGASWGAADPTVDQVAAALEAGRLVEVEKPRGVELHPDAEAAFAAAVDANKAGTGQKED